MLVYLPGLYDVFDVCRVQFAKHIESLHLQSDRVGTSCQVKMAPGSGYLSVKPGVKVKVLYIGSADEEGCPDWWSALMDRVEKCAVI